MSDLMSEIKDSFKPLFDFFGFGLITVGVYVSVIEVYFYQDISESFYLFLGGILTIIFARMNSSYQIIKNNFDRNPNANEKGLEKLKSQKEIHRKYIKYEKGLIVIGVCILLFLFSKNLII